MNVLRYLSLEFTLKNPKPVQRLLSTKQMFHQNAGGTTICKSKIFSDFQNEHTTFLKKGLTRLAFYVWS